MGLLPGCVTPGPARQLLKDFDPLPLQVWALQQEVCSANGSPDKGRTSVNQIY